MVKKFEKTEAFLGKGKVKRLCGRGNFEKTLKKALIESKDKSATPVSNVARNFVGGRS